MKASYFFFVVLCSIIIVSAEEVPAPDKLSTNVDNTSGDEVPPTDTSAALDELTHKSGDGEQQFAPRKGGGGGWGGGQQPGSGNGGDGWSGSSQQPGSGNGGGGWGQQHGSGNGGGWGQQPGSSNGGGWGQQPGSGNSGGGWGQPGSGNEGGGGPQPGPGNGGGGSDQCSDEISCSRHTYDRCLHHEWMWSKCPNLCDTCKCRDTDAKCRIYFNQNRCTEDRVRFACRRTCELCISEWGR